MGSLLTALLLTITIVNASFVTAASSEDKHAGYYYPEPQSSETYISRLSKMATASKRSRVGFTVGLNAKQAARAYAPSFHMFAKGAQTQKLIIVAVEENRYNTLFRLRALLASLTANARKSLLFSDTEMPEELIFLDLCKLAGFTRLTITNGRDVTHRIFVV